MLNSPRNIEQRLHGLCEGVGVVKRVHTLLGGVHRLATALKEVEEVVGGSARDKR